MTFSLVLDVISLIPIERRIHEVAHPASSLEDRAVPRMLREKRPLAFPLGSEANSRPGQVGEEPHFEGSVLRLHAVCDCFVAGPNVASRVGSSGLGQTGRPGSAASARCCNGITNYVGVYVEANSVRCEGGDS